MNFWTVLAMLIVAVISFCLGVITDAHADLKQNDSFWKGERDFWYEMSEGWRKLYFRCIDLEDFAKSDETEEDSED